MLTNRQFHRLKFYLLILVLFALVVFLFIYGIKENINLFLTPTELQAKASIAAKTEIKLGGLVEKDSVFRDHNHVLNFSVTDQKNSIKVRFAGVVPDLFREGQGVVMLGMLQQNVFVASKIMAKHDEKYVRPKP